MNNKHLIELTTVLDNISQPIFIHDAQYKVLYANRAYIELSGGSESDIIDRVYWQSFPKADGPMKCCEKKMQTDEKTAKEKIVVNTQEGERIYNAFSYIVENSNEYAYSVHVFEDVTANSSLISQAKNDSALLQQVFDYAGDAIFIVDFSGKIVDANKMATVRMGCSYAELIQLSVFDIDKKITVEKLNQIALALKNQRQVYFESRLHPKNAQTFPVEINISLLNKNDTPFFLAVVRDASRLHSVQHALENRLAIERTIRQVEATLITQKPFSKKFQSAVDELRHSMKADRCYLFSYDSEAEIFIKEYESHSQTTLPIDMTPPLTTFGSHFPQATQQLMSNMPVLIDNTLEEVIEDRHLKHLVKKQHIRSIYFIPINYQSNYFGFIGLDYIESEHEWNKNDIKLLEALSPVFAELFLLQEYETKQQNLIQKQKEIIHKTAEAINRMLEARDPYTAGHQEEVAILSYAIAKQMQLEQQEIEQIYFGAKLHDIGKIQLPYEILSSPKKLNASEYELIKSHPLAGYSILEPIPFADTVKNIVLQHHERLSSGYPGGLKGDQISLGARIVAVADTVQSMSSYRPYHPSLTIDDAIDEINKNAGVLYDADVVKHCLTILTKNDFSFQKLKDDFNATE